MELRVRKIQGCFTPNVLKTQGCFATKVVKTQGCLLFLTGNQCMKLWIYEVYRVIVVGWWNWQTQGT